MITEEDYIYLQEEHIKLQVEHIELLEAYKEELRQHNETAKKYSNLLDKVNQVGEYLLPKMDKFNFLFPFVRFGVMVKVLNILFAKEK